jgi:hypothetical protein
MAALPDLPSITKRDTALLWIAIALGAISGLYWYSVLDIHNIVLSTWFGWLNCLVASFCYYLELSILRTDSEISELYSHVYNFKTV